MSTRLRYATISAPKLLHLPTQPCPQYRRYHSAYQSLRGPDLDVIYERDKVSLQHAASKKDLRAMENKILDVEDFDPDAWACVISYPYYRSRDLSQTSS